MLTVENFNHENIKEEIKEWSHVEKVRFAIFSVDLLIGFFEGEYPNDDRTRLAIEAVEEWCESPTEENEEKCRVADDAYPSCVTYDATIAATAAAAFPGRKQKIIDYINNKNNNSSIFSIVINAISKMFMK